MQGRYKSSLYEVYRVAFKERSGLSCSKSTIAAERVHFNYRKFSFIWHSQDITFEVIFLLSVIFIAYKHQQKSSQREHREGGSSKQLKLVEKKKRRHSEFSIFRKGTLFWYCFLFSSNRYILIEFHLLVQARMRKKGNSPYNSLSSIDWSTKFYFHRDYIVLGFPTASNMKLFCWNSYTSAYQSK